MSHDPLTTAKDVSEIVSNVTTVVGLVIAGVWTFYHFVSGRVFKPRVTIALTARRLCSPSGDYVVCAIQVSNIGLSKVDISDGDMQVWSLSDDRRRIRIGGDKVLTNHQWIEPGSTLREQGAIPCSDTAAIIYADVRLVARAKDWRGRSTESASFSTNTIVGTRSDGDQQDQKE